MCSLDVVCVNEVGRAIVERSIRLDADQTEIAAKLLASLPANGALKVEQSDNTARVVHPDFTVNLNRKTGEMEIRSPTGSLLASGFYPHTGRRFTLAEQLRTNSKKKESTESDLSTGISSIWPDAILRTSEVQLAEAKSTADGARVMVRGKYRRTDAPNQYFAGEVVLVISTNGSIAVSYDFKPVNADGQLLEVGLSVLTPPAQTELRWIGAGPFAGYPGKDALNEFGLHHLTNGDIRFRGNRRDVDLALLTSPAGPGVLFGGTNMDVAVENTEMGCIFSHNALVSGLGNKGGEPRADLTASNIKRIAGQFTLVPLANDWPAALKRWFSSTAGAVEVQKPYYRSYDQ